MAFPTDDDGDVRRFHEAATAAGYRNNGPPGERPRYHPGYYAAYVLDPDGNSVEVVNHHRAYLGSGCPWAGVAPWDMAPRTLTAKLLESHAAGADADLLALNVDQVLIEDATGTMAALQFEPLGVERCQVPLAVCYVDHNVLQIDERNQEDHHYLQAFCRRHGIHYSRPGNGISHYVHLERYGRPGALMIGADSHTSTAGALAMLAVGVGGLEVAVAMAGHAFQLPRPRVAGVELRGRLAPGTQAKDVVLELLRRHGVRGAVGAIFEFHGDGADALSVPERATICNMVVETGATTAVFASDERTRRWLALQEREDEFAALAADPGAAYDEDERIDLGELEPLVARPSSPGDVVAVGEVEGTEISQVCVGSSVNSSYDDLAIVAAALRDATVHPDIDLTVTPGSRQILDTIVRSGVYADLVQAGARMLEPACGPCIGVGQAPATGHGSLRTFNRNFPGRSGAQDDRVYLCSPATAAASAVAGRIADPRRSTAGAGAGRCPSACGSTAATCLRRRRPGRPRASRCRGRARLRRRRRRRRPRTSSKAPS